MQKRKRKFGDRYDGRRVRTLSPVSYTHLDVYKRQEYDYTIDAATGEVTNSDDDIDDFDLTKLSKDATFVTIDAASATALAKVQDATKDTLSIKLELSEDGKTGKYIGTLADETTDHPFEIDAVSGKLTKWDGEDVTDDVQGEE